MTNEKMIIHKLIEAIKPYKFNIKSIVDIGTRDLWQSCEFHEIYPQAKIYAFEANKESYTQCIKQGFDFIKVFNYAILDKDGETKFYNVSQKDNYGASSIFEPTENMVGVDFINGLEKTIVPCKRIDTWAKENDVDSIDLAWIDVQGAEIPVLEGFGDLLDKVKVIATEAETGELYFGNRTHNPTKYEELKSYLESKGFIEIAKDQPWPMEVDVIYIKK